MDTSLLKGITTNPEGRVVLDEDLIEEATYDSPGSVVMFTTIGFTDGKEPHADVSGFTDCRESLQSYINNLLGVGNKQSKLYKDFKKLDPTHIPILIWVDTKEQKRSVVNKDCLVYLLNSVEYLFKLEHTSFISRTNVTGMYVVHMPVFWAKATPFTSLYTLLVRIGTKFSGKSDPLTWLKKAAITDVRVEDPDEDEHGTDQDYDDNIGFSDSAWLGQGLAKIDLLLEHGVDSEMLAKAVKVATNTNYGIARLTTADILKAAGKEAPKEAPKAVYANF